MSHGRDFPSDRVVAGKWDDRAGGLRPFRCRWFFSWTDLDAGRIAGFFAGYEGGGAFIEERFLARFEGSDLMQFIWNGWDHVSGETYEPDDDLERWGDEHFDVFIHWHDRDQWERGFLCLAPGRESELALLPTSLLLEPSSAEARERIAALVKRTGILCSFNDLTAHRACRKDAR